MYEHAYHMDYGAKAAACVDAFMEAIQWDSAMKQFDHVSREKLNAFFSGPDGNRPPSRSKCSAAARNSPITGSCTKQPTRGMHR
jgi:hypothetical protein